METHCDGILRTAIWNRESMFKIEESENLKSFETSSNVNICKFQNNLLKQIILAVYNDDFLAKPGIEME